MNKCSTLKFNLQISASTYVWPEKLKTWRIMWTQRSQRLFKNICLQLMNRRWNSYRTKGNYNFDIRTVKVFYTYMCEISVHWWRNSLTPGGNPKKVDYKAVFFVLSTFPGQTDTIENILLLSPEQSVYKNLKGSDKKSFMTRLEEQSVPCLQKLVEKFKNPGIYGYIYTILDQCGYSYSTACAFMLYHFIVAVLCRTEVLRVINVG